MRYAITLLVFLLYSCGTKQQQNTPGHTIKVVEAKPHVVRADSVEPPAVYSLSDAVLRTFPMGKPTITQLTSNIRPAAQPVAIEAGSPRISIPGRDSCAIPIPVPAVDSVNIAGQPEVVVAGKMARKEINSASVGYFSKLEGLKHDEVNCVLEDHQGNVWFGTGDGATRYDGHYFSHFSTKQGLVNDHILCMLEDQQGNIWFGTNNGVSKYDGRILHNFTWERGIGGKVIYCMLQDHLGAIWMGTSNGLTRYDGRSFYNYSTKEGFCNNAVYGIFEDYNGNLWIGTLGSGAFRYNGIQFERFTSKEGLGSDNVLSIQQDLQRNIWFGTAGGGLSRFDRNSFWNYTTEHGLSDNSVGCMEIDHLGNLWLGTTGGVCRFDGETFSAYSTANGLSSNLIYSVREDRSGNVWVGTGGGGVCRIDGAKFSHMSSQEGLMNSSVQAIMEESTGNCWLGTADGLIRRESSNLENYNYEFDSSLRLSVRSAMKDKTGKIWLGIDRRGFVWFDGIDFKEFVLKKELENVNFNQIFQDRLGIIWFCAYGDGIFRFDGKSFTHFTTKNGISTNLVTCALEDCFGNFWFGSEGGGVTYYNGTEFSDYTTKNGLSGNEVYSMLQDRWGNIWIGTHNGLNRYDGHSFSTFTTADGLSNDAILSLWEDSTSTGSDLWIGTRMGLCRVATEKIEEKFKTGNYHPFLSDEEVLFKTYDTYDGFLGIGCNRGAMQRMSDGNLWVGANNLLTIINTENLQNDIIAPNISLVGLDLFNEKVNWQQSLANPDGFIELSNGVQIKNAQIDSLSHWYGVPQGLSLAHDNNNVTFRFVGITMHQPSRVKYRYKLDGFDKDWSAITSENTAPYGNLPAGSYTFMVKAMNSEGVWSAPLEFSFTVRPPWWQTWWANAVYCLLFLWMFSNIVRFRIRALNRRRLALERSIERATREIRSQKDEIENQKKRSDELLMNILPEEVAEELKARGEAQARLMENGTVLFTDFKGFTQVSERLSPQQLVNEIHEYFSAFDIIIEKHGIEKIKTIGDAYMAAGGLPIPNSTHALDVVAAAIEINRFMEDQKKRKKSLGESYFEIRIGIHTGPVVAGIVGVKKFQYDIWGDTVNTASRMESAGEAGRINISESTYELVKAEYACEFRGEVEAKGKGKLRMYFVSESVMQ